MSPFVDDMIVYIENPKDSTKKLVQLINVFSKVAGYKINILKLVVFFYTEIHYRNNKLTERENKETIPFYNCIKKNKIPRNKFS